MSTLDERLITLGNIVKSKTFQMKKGNANEVPYYVFDYDPKYELDVMDYVQLLAAEINTPETQNPLYVFDIYDIMMSFFEQKNFVRRFDRLEETKGFLELARQMNNSLGLTSERGHNYISEYIIQHVEMTDHTYPVVFLVGIGKCFPIIRSHRILNFMHQDFSDVPVVALFPGTYDGQYLRPFGTIQSENYYRAFKLVP